VIVPTAMPVGSTNGGCSGQGVGSTAAVAPAVVLAGAPATVTTPMACSREATAAA
jgi:hypothetical protein